MATNPVDPYAQIYRSVQRREQTQQRAFSGSSLEQAMQDERDNQIRLGIIAAPAPDAVAKATKIARDTDVAPGEVDGNLASAEKMQQANRMTAVLGKYPAFTRFAQTNPRAVAAAADDHKALGILGDAWDYLGNMGSAIDATWSVQKALGILGDAWDYLGNMGIAIGATWSVQGAKANYALADFFGEASDALSGFASPNTQTVGQVEERKAARKAYWRSGIASADTWRKAAMPKTDSYVLGQVNEGIANLGPSLFALVAGAVTKSPGLTMALMGAQTGLPAYSDARVAGKGVADSTRYGFTQGAIEVATEKIPAMSLVDDIVKRTPIGKTIIRQSGQEIPGEQVATILQDFSTWATLNPEKPFSAYVAERPQAALDTLIQTAVGTTAQTSLTVAVDRTVQSVAKVAGRVVQAREAKHEAEFFNRVERAAAESNHLGRDPETYAEFMEFVANDKGVGQVFIPAEAIRAYQQSDSYDQFDDPFADYQAQIDEAFEVGGDVVLPAGFALGTLPGTPAWAAVKADMRLAPGGMSAREADDLSSQLDDIMGELTDQAYQRDADQQGERDARGQIVERVSAMLQNAGFTPANARVQAELIAQKEAVRATRMGRELTGAEFGTEVVSVLPPALSEIQKADSLDLVVNALRKGKPATVQRGKSLLEWIAARGGVEDVGGDIASMGGDKWHKGKVGKRKLIKPSNEAQGSIIGGEFNPNTVENTLDAAISEGFFPDLLAQRETGEGYADKIDTGVLLAAIADELAGRSTYAEEAVTDNVRAAAAELEQMLAERGLVASELTDAEIRAAVGQMEQEGSGGVVYDQLPESIDIDGVARPTRNSEGMPLAGSEEGLRAFWKWFGDSKVVDEEGRPLVVYHGTGDQFEAFDVSKIGLNATALGYGFYFAVNKDVARGYESDGGTILPVYLAIEAPVGSDAKRLTGPKLKALVRAAVEAEIAAYPDEIPDYKDGFLSNVVDTYSTSYKDAVDEFARILAENDTAVNQLAELANVMGSKKQAFDAATRSGIDGIFVKDFQDGDGPVWIATSPTQIKSINNRGSFDPADARILYQAAYHGSPHIFDRFSLDAIGTGEGAQAYGWGLYFAGRKEIAEFYKTSVRRNLEQLQAIAADQGLTDGASELLAFQFARDFGGKSFDQWLDTLERDDPLTDKYSRQAINELLDNTVSAADAVANMKTGGRLYQVDIPNDDEYLLWDKPLSEQPGEVWDNVIDAVQRSMPDEVASELAAMFELGDVSGKDAYNWIGTAFEKGFVPDGAFGTPSGKAAQMASEIMRDAGIAGIKYLDGGSRTAGDGSFNYVVFDDSRVSITAYEQSLNEGARGRILMDGNRPFRIELFQERNLSTLLHELSHQWLEELRADAENPDAPEQVKADWQAVTEWFAANGNPIVDGVIPVEAHEMWARGGERYIMEGKAPSPALTGLFETFRGWLLSIYKTVQALRAPITPEIREVFDRLLATDEEIAAMAEMQALQPMFKDAAAIGMTGQEFDAYKAQAQAARDEANSTLLAKTMAAIRRRETKKFRDEKRAVMADEAERLNDEPLLKSIRLMQATPIDQEWLVDRMGLDVLSLLPKRVPPLWRERGVNPDSLAELAGFGSGQQMIEVLIGAERQHRQAREGGDQRTMRARMIENAADAEMTLRYGDDPLNDGSIEQEAIAAVNGELQGELLASEVRLLSRRTGQRPTPYKIARQWARNRVRTGLVSVEASPGAIQRHARNVAKAGRDAEKAMLAGKMDEALRFKQQQMLSSALLAEAKEASDEVNAAVKRMGKIAKRATMKSVDQDYLEQAHALLEAVDLKERTQKSLNRKTSFEAWAAAQAANGNEVFVPEGFRYEGTNWTRLPVEQLLGMDDAIKSIMHLGALKQSLLDNKERRAFEDWRDEARAGLEAAPGRKVTAELGDPSRPLAGLFSNLMKMEVFAAEMDNDVTNGPWQRLMVQRATEAANYRDEQRNRVLTPIADLYRSLSNKTRDRYADKYVFDEILYRSPDLTDPRNGTPISGTRWDIIGMALNMGSESSFDKLARGYGVSQDVIETIVMRELTQEDWQFVSSVWSSLESLWPDIAKAERELQGVEPERVTLREVETPFGKLAGGYYPAVYDPAFDQRTEDNLKDAENDLFGKRSGVATSKGHTVARTDYAAPMLLSPERVIFQHVEKVITRNAYAGWVRDVLKAVKDPSLRSLIDRQFGPEFRQQIEPWLQAQVREGLGNERATRFAEKFARTARTNVTIVSMGLRWSTGVAQTIGLANSIGRIGVGGMRRGMARMLSNPKAAWAFISERSPEMVSRNEAMNRDVSEAFREMRRIRTKNGILDKAAAFKSKANAYAFWHIGMIDRWMVAAPTWLGAYENAIRDGMDDVAASAYGDKMVRLSQGSGREKDLSAWQSNQSSEFLKFFSMFYTPFNVLLNAQWEAGRALRRNDYRKSAMLAFWFMIATPLLDAVLAGDVPDDDDEEGWSQWLARNIGFYLFAGVPVLRDVAAYTERKISGQYATFNVGPIARVLDSTEDLAKDIANDEASDKWVRHAIETPGYFLGLPTGQVGQTAQFLWDVSEGDADPETMADWYSGLTKGRMPED